MYVKCKKISEVRRHWKWYGATGPQEWICICGAQTGSFYEKQCEGLKLEKKKKKSSYFTEKIGFSSPPTSFSFSKVVVLKIQLKYKNIATLHIYHPPPPPAWGGG